MLKAIKEFFFGTPKAPVEEVPYKVEAVNAQPVVKEVVAAPVVAPAPTPEVKPQATKKPRQQKQSGAPKARKPKAPK